MRQPNSDPNASVIRIWLVVSVIAIIAVAISFYVTRRDTQEASGYDSIKNESSYQLEITSWSGTDEHNILLEKDDMLHVEWNLYAGVIGVTITEQGQKPIYAANDVSVEDNPDASFDVIVPVSGEYKISIAAQKATGTIGVIKTEPVEK